MVIIMTKYKVDIAGINTNNLKVLTNEEMTYLFKEMSKGNSLAREQLINGNLKLVLSILRKFNNHNDNLDDLFQIGCIGLLKAVDNFDLSHEVKFSTYAVPMILGEIKRYIRDNNPIRISRSLKDIAYKSLKIKEQSLQETGKEAGIDEIAKELNVLPIDIINSLESLKKPVSIFEPVYNDGGDTIYLCDQIEDKKIEENDFANKVALKDAINDLEERERQILDNRYMIGKTQVEIAEELGIIQAQVSRLEKKAIKQLKKVL